MSRALTVLAILLCAGLLGVPTRADCRKANETQQCLGCANQVVELEQTRAGTKIRGSVYMDANFEPFAGVLVEVFTRPENATPLWNLEGTSQRTRVAACFVGENGKFRFHLKPGKYELRFSHSDGWNCTYIKIDVVEGLRTKKFKVPMQIGT